MKKDENSACCWENNLYGCNMTLISVNVYLKLPTSVSSSQPSSMSSIGHKHPIFLQILLPLQQVDLVFD